MLPDRSLNSNNLLFEMSSSTVYILLFDAKPIAQILIMLLKVKRHIWGAASAAFLLPNPKSKLWNGMLRDSVPSTAEDYERHAQIFRVNVTKVFLLPTS